MPEQPEIKPIYLSKTAIVNAIIALAALYPPAKEWVSENASIALLGIGAINVLLRLITRGRVSIV